LRAVVGRRVVEFGVFLIIKTQFPMGWRRIQRVLIKRKAAMGSSCIRKIPAREHQKESVLMREWHPILTAPLGRNLQLSVHENEEVHSLVFPCRQTERGWVDASKGTPVLVDPTHWREWAD